MATAGSILTTPIPYRPWMTPPLVVGGAVAFGALIAIRPSAAVGLVGLALIALLAFAAPVAHLMLLVFLTAIVPYGLQNQYGIGGGAASAGLLLSDVVLMLGLAWAMIALIRRPPDPWRLLLIAVVTVFLAGACVQFLRGVMLLGRPISEVGAEFRVLLGFGSILIAVPIFSDPARRARLVNALIGFGLVLGMWGLIQWTVDIPFAAAGDVGVREGVRFTSEGRGQIQGGLYAFAPMTLILFSLLISGVARTTLMRVVLITALVLNAASLLLTYERTFWVATVLGLGVVIVRTGGTQRLKAAVATPLALVAFLAILATVAPSTLGAARERLVSIGQYSSDDSLRYRVVESRHVVDEIRKRPLTGSAPGAEILWGRPWEFVKPSSTPYAHNGYLWLTWKVGAPLAVLLFALMLAAIVRPAPRGYTAEAALARGCQVGLLVLLLATATFPSFSALAITPLMGVFAAAALVIPGGPRRPPALQARPLAARGASAPP